MSFLAVKIPAELDAVNRAEADSSSIPQSLAAFCEQDGPRPYRRFRRDGEVLDLLAWETADDPAEFIDRAAAVTAAYDRALGVPIESKFWNTMWHSLGEEVAQFPVGTSGVDGSVMITIHYPTSTLDRLAVAEKERPDLMEGFVEALRGNGLITHSRFHKEGEVLDLDEFADAEGFHRFLGVAQPLIDEYAALTGGEAIGTLYYRA